MLAALSACSQGASRQDVSESHAWKLLAELTSGSQAAVLLHVEEECACRNFVYAAKTFSIHPQYLSITYPPLQLRIYSSQQATLLATSQRDCALRQQ